MNSLQIHDGFEPYFAGRAAFGQQKPLPSKGRERASQKDSEAALEQGDVSPKSNADANLVSNEERASKDA